MEGSTDFGLTQRLRYVVPVFITVPGQMEAGFGLTDIALTSNDEALLIRLSIENTGDVRVRPEGDVIVTDSTGTLIATIPVTMQSVYAHDSTILTLGVPLDVGDETYGVDVDLSDPDTGESVSGSVSDVRPELESQASAATPGPQALFIESASVVPGPSTGDVQFVTVDATIVNAGDPVGNAQLSLAVGLNGEDVERFPINQSLSLPTGETAVSARYIPVTGWTEGEWSFELLLEIVQPDGAAVVETSFPIPEAVTIE